MVTLLTRLDAKDEAAATALAAVLSELSGTVPSEPGSLAYEAFGTEEDPTTYLRQRELVLARGRQSPRAPCRVGRLRRAIGGSARNAVRNRHAACNLARKPRPPRTRR